MRVIKGGSCGARLFHFHENPGYITDNTDLEYITIYLLGKDKRDVNRIGEPSHGERITHMRTEGMQQLVNAGKYE